MLKRTLGFPLLIAIIGLALAACGPQATPAVPKAEATKAPAPTATSAPAKPKPGPLGAVELGPDDPIKIAAIQAISGAVASLGTDQVRGIEIAIDDHGGKLLGHPIELQVEDGQCNSEGGTTAAQKIVSDPQIIGIIGTSCSGAAVPASRIMSQAGLVMISGSNTSPYLTSLGGKRGNANQPGYFRTAHNDEVQGRAAATFVFKKLGIKKAASIHDGDPYTQGLVMVFNQVFKELGGEIVLTTAINKGDTDMRPVLTSVAAAKPGLIYFPIFQPEADHIVIQSKEFSELKDVVLMGADGLLSDTFVVIPETKGMYFSGPATPQGPAYEEFVAKYEKKYGEKPIQAFHAQTYDATNMLLAAVKKVALKLPDGGLFIDRQALRDALYATKGFKGLTGTLTCDQFGDCADPKINVYRNDDPSASLEGVMKNIVFTYKP